MPRSIETKELFTTGDIAKLCRVAPRTVSKWIDGGRLPGFRLPGSKDRRVEPGKFAKFLREHGMDVPPWLATRYPVPRE